MFAKLIIELFKLDYKNNYFSSTALIAELTAILGTLTIYWFTAKAFKFATPNQNYFHYIVIADIFLALPLYFLDTFIRKVKQAVQEKTLYTFLSLSIPLYKTIILIGAGGVIRELIRIITITIISILLFSPFSSLSNIFTALGFMTLFLPIFILLGITFTMLLLYLHRGSGIISYLNLASSVLAGAFFPITVFPLWLQKSSIYLTPIVLFLENIRRILNSQPLLPNTIITTIFWFFLSTILAYLSYQLIHKKLQEKGFNILFTA